MVETLPVGELKEPTEHLVDGEFRGRKPTLALAKIILSHHPYKHFCAVVYGKKRLGKSVYCLRVMQQIFEAFGFNEEEAWNRAMGSLHYDIDEFRESLQYFNERVKEDFRAKTPVMTIDDAGVGFGKRRWFDRRDQAERLQRGFDTIGLLCTGLLFTTPDPENLLVNIRVSLDMRIWITKSREWDDNWKGHKKREARGYAVSLSPIGKRYISKDGGLLDTYSVKLSDDRWEEYHKIRSGYMDSIL